MNYKLLLTAVLLLSSISAYPSEKYISVKRFFAAHPAEAAKYEKFLRSVEKPGEAAGDIDPVEIALIYPAKQVSDYWRRSADVIGARLSEMGVRHRLIRMYTKPSGDERIAVRQLMKAVRQRVDYVVVSVNSAIMEKAVGRVLAEKTPKIIIQNLVTPIEKWEINPPLMYVGFDHVTGTNLLADWFADNAPNEGSYGVLLAGSDMVSKLRGEKFISSYSAKGRMRHAGSYYTDFDRQKAARAARKLLADNADLRALYSCATDISLAAAEIVSRSGRNSRITLNGWGGGKAELEAVAKGELDVTVMRINDDNGAAVAQAIVYDRLGKGGEVPLIFPGRFVLIDSDTAKSETEMYMQEAFRYSGER